MDFGALAHECAPWVAYQTMAAIVKTESAFRPLAIRINGGARLTRQPQTREEAVVTAKWLMANGYSIDLGLGQVNSSNLARIGLTVEDAFDPCKNIAAAARILRANYQTARRKVPGEQAALQAALSAYNTGSFSKGFSNGYVQRVVNNAGAVMPDVGAQVSENAPTPAVKLAAQAVGEAAPQSSDAGVYRANDESPMVY